MIPFSILDLSPILVGSDASRSFRNTLDLARHAERWGYRRYWLAEHHGMPGIASAATAVLIGHGFARHKIGTLESSGRIDLGRALGPDQPTARALRRNLATGP